VIPLCTTNRINSPDVAEDILAKGHADMISMARPFLADPYFMKKSKENRAKEINTCIGCNQACLGHIFVGKRASCLVNPIAAYETSLVLTPVTPAQKKRVAVVGAGPAGFYLSSSCSLCLTLTPVLPARLFFLSRFILCRCSSLSRT
jgi:2,4-dienoyl-CoA reductase (NADPH2)